MGKGKKEALFALPSSDMFRISQKKPKKLSGLTLKHKQVLNLGSAFFSLGLSLRIRKLLSRKLPFYPAKKVTTVSYFLACGDFLQTFGLIHVAEEEERASKEALEFVRSIHIPAKPYFL